MKKRLVSAFLAVVMMLTLVMAVSCSDEGSETKTGDVVQTAEDNFEIKDLGGYELKVYTRGEESGFGPWQTVDLTAEELNSEIINDAVYNRNAAIEQKYNFTIKSVVSPADQYEQAQASIISQDGAFDLIIADGQICAQLAQNGYLIDLNSIKDLDLSQDWWDQNANSDLSIGDKLYFTTGDLSISAADATWVTTFNKSVLQEFSIESPYTLVDNNEWTFEKLLSLAKDVTADIDGDGAMTENDRYGYIYEPFNNYALFSAFGNSISSKDEDGYPVLSVFTDHSVSSFELIQKVSDDRDNYFINWSTDCYKVFSDNRALFGATTILTVRLTYKEMESDYGILPMPKYDENQDRYYDIVNASTCSSFYCIPTSAADPEKTGYALSALCHDSKTTLRPAYYELALERRSMRDEDSVRMLDIILDSRCYDIATIYNWGDWYSFFYPGMYDNIGINFASTYNANSGATLSAIQATVDAYKNNLS